MWTATTASSPARFLDRVLARYAKSLGVDIDKGRGTAGRNDGFKTTGQQ